MKSVKPVARVRALLMALAATAVLGGCGGGSQPIEPFAPTRMVVFGDESSMLLSDGRKYTVNGSGAISSTVDCASNPLYIQTVASHYGIVFPQCNPTNLAAPQGRIMATVGARVDDVRQQVDKYLSSDFIDAKTLLTLYVGANDILALYAQFPAQSEGTLLNQAAQAGTLLGDQAIRLARAGGRPIVVSAIDQGTTPFAIIERRVRPDIDRAALLSRLTRAFNDALYLRLGDLNDGRQMGLVMADDAFSSVVKFPAAQGYANVQDSACEPTVALPNCTTSTLRREAEGNLPGWLWADDRRLSPSGQALLGQLVLARAVRNPL